MHTPGPWIVVKQHGAARDFGRLYCVATDPQTLQGRYGAVADVCGPGELSMTVDDQAALDNARLIAASPALLGVCQACLHQLSTDSDLDEVTAPEKYRELVAGLKAAIYAADPGFPPLCNYFPT